MFDLDDKSSEGLALARKWRPRCFAEVVGQDSAVRILLGALKSNRFHHAYMLSGTRGVGKTTIARILAKALNCSKTQDSGEACDECDSCAQIDAGGHPDVIEMDAASATQVEYMRDLLDSAQFAPAMSRFKVYIIDEVHMLSRHAFNAMLKTLEEPPEHVKFILATTDPHQVPATVQSRCLRFPLRRVDKEVIAAHLEDILNKEGRSYEKDAVDIIANQADGSIRDSLSILDEAIVAVDKLETANVRKLLGLAGVENLPELLTFLLTGDVNSALSLANDMHMQSANLDNALSELAILASRCQIAAFAPKTEEDPQSLPNIDSVQAQLVYEIACHSRDSLKSAPDPKVAFDMALLRIAALFADLGTTPTAAQIPAKSTPAPAAKPAVQAKKEPPVETQTQTKPATNKTVMPLDNEQDWLKLCSQLTDERGIALAKKCVFVRNDNSTLTLTISKSNSAQKRASRFLLNEINECLQANLVLEIDELEEQSGITPTQDQNEKDELLKKKLAEQVEKNELQLIRQSFPNSKIEKVTLNKDTD